MVFMRSYWLSCCDRRYGLCIAIRTMILKNQKKPMFKGAGVVYDRVPENEFTKRLTRRKL